MGGSIRCFIFVILNYSSCLLKLFLDFRLQYFAQIATLMSYLYEQQQNSCIVKKSNNSAVSLRPQTVIFLIEIQNFNISSGNLFMYLRSCAAGGSESGQRTKKDRAWPSIISQLMAALVVPKLSTVFNFDN